MTSSQTVDVTAYEIALRSVALVGPHRELIMLHRGDALPVWVSAEQLQQLHDDDNLDHYGRI